MVRWIFQARLESYSYRRIVTALTEIGVPCPSAADPERNTHRTGKLWTEGAVRAILINPVYTGYNVWGEDKTLRVLIDPGNPALGYAKRRTHTTPDQWSISHHPSHPPLVTVADFLAVQGLRVPRAAPEHHYRLTGILACAECGRAMEATWSHNHPAYRCRHGRPSTASPARLNPAQAFIREQHILDRLLLYGHLTKLHANGHPVLTAGSAGPHTLASPESNPVPNDAIAYLRHHGLVLTYHHDNHTIEANSRPPVCVRV